jgi:hypothetical protein
MDIFCKMMLWNILLTTAIICEVLENEIICKNSSLLYILVLTTVTITSRETQRQNYTRPTLTMPEFSTKKYHINSFPVPEDELQKLSKNLFICCQACLRAELGNFSIVVKYGKSISFLQ